MVKNTIDEMIPSSKLEDDDQEPAVMISDKCFNASIPTLDMKALVDPQTRTIQLDNFHRSCKEWGIFQVVNHGMDPKLIHKLKHEIQEFYKLPLEDRLRYAVRPGHVEGYGQREVDMSADGKHDWGDRFYMTVNPINARKPHLLPSFPSSLRESMEAYISEQQKLARAIFGLTAEALKIEAREMEEMFEDGMQSIRMNYYSACPEPDKVLGISPHTDGSGITLLLQVNSVEGFQIKKDGVWTPINFLQDALVVNLGDIIEIVSNGSYKSVEHRVVVNAEKERISMAMFFNPKMEAQVGPSPSLLINHRQPPLFRTIKADQYFQEYFSRKLHAKAVLDYMKI